MAKSNYSVGYGKPPSKSKFKPGKSGNPKGRPKGVKNLATDLSEELSEQVLVTESGKPRVVTKQRAMIKALVARSLKGDARAASTLLNLIPAVEQAQFDAVKAEALSATDQEILSAFRKQIVEGLKSEKARSKS